MSGAYGPKREAARDLVISILRGRKLTKWEIVNETKKMSAKGVIDKPLTIQQVGRACQDIRNTGVEWVTIPTHDGDYKHTLPAEVVDMLPGILNQLTHNLTRARSEMKASQAILARAKTATDLKIANLLENAAKQTEAGHSLVITALDVLISSTRTTTT